MRGVLLWFICVLAPRSYAKQLTYVGHRHLCLSCAFVIAHSRRTFSRMSPHRTTLLCEAFHPNRLGSLAFESRCDFWDQSSNSAIATRKHGHGLARASTSVSRHMKRITAMCVCVCVCCSVCSLCECVRVYAWYLSVIVCEVFVLAHTGWHVHRQRFTGCCAQPWVNHV